MAVLPADEDGFGIVLIEALATGLPVVTSDVPGHDEAITPATGALYSPHDPEQLAQAVIDVLATPDPGRIEAGRSRVESFFTTERMVSRHLDIYEQVLRSSVSSHLP